MPPTPLIHFESVALLPFDAPHNHHWLITASGNLHFHRNSPGAVRPEEADLYWYDAPLPHQPTLTLSTEDLEALNAYIATLAAHPPHTRRDSPDTEGGGWDRLTAQTPQGTVVIELHSAHQGDMRAFITPIQNLWATK